MPAKAGGLRAALYGRVSTQEQTTLNQILDLRRYAKERGWTVAGEYIDHGVSGTKAMRPGLDDLMAVARKKQIDIVLVWRFDRFARSVKHLVLALDELRSLGIGFVSYHENIDTNSPLGAAIFTIIAAMAALERDIIVERVKAGIGRARNQGKKLGRPLVSVDTARLKSLQLQGLSLREIARRMRLSRGTVARALQRPR